MNKCHACCILSREFSGMQKNDESRKKNSSGVTGSDNGKLNRRSIGFRQRKAESQEYQVRTMESWIAGVSNSDDGKPESSEGTEGALNPIIKPGGKFSYLRVSCYFDVNYVKHNLHQSGGKLLTLDFCP